MSDDEYDDNVSENTDYSNISNDEDGSDLDRSFDDQPLNMEDETRNYDGTKLSRVSGNVREDINSNTTLNTTTMGAGNTNMNKAQNRIYRMSNPYEKIEALIQDYKDIDEFKDQLDNQQQNRILKNSNKLSKLKRKYLNSTAFIFSHFVVLKNSRKIHSEKIDEIIKSISDVNEKSKARITFISKYDILRYAFLIVDLEN